jgi:hypothetical protein
MTRNDSKVISGFNCKAGVRGFLLYTEDQGLWKERKWNKITAQVSENKVISDVPKKAKVFFLAIEDVTGVYVSSPYEEVL